MYYNQLISNDELYHHGIKGQKWGVRRFQNQDGSLTPTGRIRYGAGKAVKATGRAISKAAKAVGSSVAKSYKKRHPEKMTDEELKQAIERINMETRYRQAVKESHPFKTRIKSALVNVMGTGIETIGRKGAERIGDDMFKKKETESERLARLAKDADNRIKIDTEESRLQVDLAKNKADVAKSAKSYLSEKKQARYLYEEEDAYRKGDSYYEEWLKRQKKYRDLGGTEKNKK